MYSKIIILLVGITLSAALSPKRSADQGLMQFMVQSRELSNGNPSRSLGCFDYYIPLLNDITAQYEKDYQGCLVQADLDRASVDNKTQPEREVIEGAARDSCAALNVCSSQNNSLSVFDCYASTGAQNSKTMYTISANATEIAATVRELYRLVQNDQDKCTNASERAYVENTASTYEELSQCLSGLAPIPTNPPSTTTTTTTTPEPTSSSSAAPESSSAAPESSSVAPESSSVAPESSSVAPESSSAAPESSSAAPESSSVAPESSPSTTESSSEAPESSSAAPAAEPQSDESNRSSSSSSSSSKEDKATDSRLEEILKNLLGRRP